MKRVLQIIAAGYPGGGTNHVLQIARGLQGSFESGLASQADSYLLGEAKRLGIRCFGLNFFSSRCDPRLSFQLRRIISKFRPHLVHVHGGRAGLFQALAFTNTPTVYSIHGFHFAHKAFPVRWLAALGERLAMRRAHYVVFECQHDRSLAQAYRVFPCHKPCTIIHNGIPSLTSSQPLGAAAPRRVGFIGRLEHQKDPMLFLDVVEHLTGYEVIMVGGGSQETALKKELETRRLCGLVKMLGPLSHQETLRVLSTLGAVVMTSRWEGLPLLPLDAMSAGVPVVATNVGGLSEIIESGKNGMLLNSRSPKEIAEAILQVTENSELRAFIVENARARVHSVFSEDRMLTDIRRVYERFSSKHDQHA